MSRRNSYTHQFAEFVPGKLMDGVLYVSVQYCTTVHKCMCGRSYEVTTPLSPAHWKLSFDGEHISLCRSIGNCSFPCEANFGLEGGTVKWGAIWRRAKVAAGRAATKRSRQRTLDGDDARGIRG